MKKIVLILIVLLNFSSIFALPSTETCLTNETLMHNITFNISGSMNYVYSYESCNWGCDNTTHSCSPDPVRSNLIMVAIVIGIAGLIFIIPKYFGR